MRSSPTRPVRSAARARLVLVRLSSARSCVSRERTSRSRFRIASFRSDASCDALASSFSASLIDAADAPLPEDGAAREDDEDDEDEADEADEDVLINPLRGRPPPPLIVPDVSMSSPLSVTTRQTARPLW